MKILRAIAWGAIGPAVYVNIEATPMPWTPFAVGSVIFAAVFVQLAQARRSFWFGTLAAVFIAINLATALGNVASMSDETRDGRSSAIERKGQVDGKRTALNKARKVQVELAGEVPAQTIEGNLQALIASDAPRWTGSEHCNPDKITLQATRTLCDQIAKLEAKKAAALKRDEIDVKLAEVDKETVFGGPSSADPYAESLARLLTVFGFQVSDEGKALLSSSKDWGKAIGLELMAAFGPMALTLLFEMMLLGLHPSPVPASGEGRAVVEYKPVADIRHEAPLPKIPLPAAPHVEPYAAMEPDAALAVNGEPAIAIAPGRRPGVMTEIPAWDEQPDAPPPSGRKRAKQRKGQTATEARSNIIPFAKKPTPSDVLDMLARGKRQHEVAADLGGISKSTVKRIKASSKRAQMSPKS